MITEDNNVDKFYNEVVNIIKNKYGLEPEEYGFTWDKAKEGRKSNTAEWYADNLDKTFDLKNRKHRVLTAEELAIRMFVRHPYGYTHFNKIQFTGKQLKAVAIEFAKLHLQAALNGIYDLKNIN